MTPRGRRVARLLTLFPLLAWAAWGCTVVGAPGSAVPPADPSGARDPAGATGRQPGGGAPAYRAGAGVDATPVRTFDEVRAAWVVRTSMTSAESVRSVVEQAAAAGLNTLLVQVRGRGDAFYLSRWEPRSERVQGGPDFDPLAMAVEEAHDRGMAVHAWVNTHLVANASAAPAEPEHILHTRPEWLAVPRALARELFALPPDDPRYVEALRRHAQENAGTVEGIYTSPSHPAVKERVYAVWMDLVERYDLDGLHFDYIRYPSGDFDYSRGALERFRAWVRPRLSPERAREVERAWSADPMAYVDALPGPWGEFRRAQITELVERIYHGVKARRPRLVVSAAVFANQVDAYRNRYQEWPAWLAAGILDVAVPMAYTPDDHRFRTQVADALSAAGSTGRVWAGVGAYLNGFDGTVAKIRIAREVGAGGVVLFSYDWMVHEGTAALGSPFLQRVGERAFRP